MSREEKIAFITSKISGMLNETGEMMPNQVDKVLNSGMLGFDGIKEGKDSTILSRAIFISFLREIITYYTNKNKNYITEIEKKAKNISYLL